ncbi:MAG: CinA family protein [Tatlockia sp.]|nr:CinA family protein [Tatlockia sp.]
MIELSEPVAKLTAILGLKNLKISTAESCTGGLIASLLTDLAGSSAWFERGFITYSNLAKQEMLSVDPQLISSHGAVSQEVAEAMALGALAHSQSPLSLAVTGIAGPGGGSVQKPVGTVWIAWAGINLIPRSSLYNFPDQSRQSVRHLACMMALQGALTFITENFGDF